MVLTRSQSKKHDDHPDGDDTDTEPMEIDEDDDLIIQPRLLALTFKEVLLGSSSDPDISLLPLFSGTL